MAELVGEEGLSLGEDRLTAARGACVVVFEQVDYVGAGGGGAGPGDGRSLRRSSFGLQMC